MTKAKLCLGMFVSLWACGNSTHQEKSHPTNGATEVPAPGPHHAYGEERPDDGRDSMIFDGRIEGSTFIEILEVVATDERLLYCTGVRGLQIVSTSDLASGDFAVSAELKSSKYSHKRFARCQHVAVEGDRVYFTNRGDMIQKTPFITGFDLSYSPPKEIVNYSTANLSVEGIAAHQGKLLATMHEQGLAIMEAKGDSLEELGRVGGFVAAWAVAASGDYAYVADASGFLGVVDLSDSKKPFLVAKLNIEGSPQSVAVSGDRVYVAAASGGLSIVDIQNPLKPVLANQIDTGAALQVSINGNNAYVANWSDARVYDISNPDKPVVSAIEIIKSSEESSRVLGMSGIGDRVFVGEWTGMYAFVLHPSRDSPHLRAGEIRIDFDRKEAGMEATSSVLLHNEGNAVLHLGDLHVSGNGFSLSSSGEKEVLPGQATSIAIRFAPSSDKEHKGQLSIRSDDPDDALIKIPLAGNHKGLSVGDPAPDIALSLINGGKWKLADQRGKVVLLSYFATF